MNRGINQYAQWCADSVLSAKSRELIQALLELHGARLERVL